MLPVHQLDVEEQGVPVLLPLLVVQGDPRVVEPPHGGLPPQHGEVDPPRRQGPGGCAVYCFPPAAAHSGPARCRKLTESQGQGNYMLGKPSKKKSSLVMEIFHKGSDPPPLFLGVMEPVIHI